MYDMYNTNLRATNGYEQNDAYASGAYVSQPINEEMNKTGGFPQNLED